VADYDAELLMPWALAASVNSWLRSEHHPADQNSGGQPFEGDQDDGDDHRAGPLLWQIGKREATQQRREGQQQWK
jgi:hypothetical protein